MKLHFKLRPQHFLLCALFLVLLIGVVLRPQERLSGVAIRFAGFTNALGQPRSAVFSVTNHSHKRIVFAVPEPQIRIGTNWTDVSPGMDPATHALDGGQSTNFTLDLPKRGDAWRMPIMWAYNGNTPEYRLRCAKNFLRGLGWQYGGALPGYTNFSADMELISGEPGGAANGSQPFRARTNRPSEAAGSRR